MRAFPIRLLNLREPGESGRPVAVLTGTRGMDIEDILLAWDPEF
jgi:hypothetical protein